MIGPVGTGLVVLAGGLAIATGWLDELGRWAGRHAAWLVVFGVAGVMVGLGVARAARRPAARRAAPALSWWVVVAGAAVVAAVAWGATTWLLREAEQAQDPAAARVEAIKTGLSIGAGTGGVLALLLAVRRQWHQERSSTATELDAAEKRVTELYTKAVEQLGSAQAPVRLGGLYALERVAQNNPDQRQTIVNVLCAYLRMPYQPPGDPPADDTEETVLAVYRERVQEREVRLTAQRLLTDHLHPGNDPKNPATTFWCDPERNLMDLNLTSAVLIAFDLTDCLLHTGTFTRSHFTGDAWFYKAHFTGDAWFYKAHFTGDAVFDEAHVADGAGFYGAHFTGDASFDRAHVVGGAGFYWAHFTGDASFDGAHVTRGAQFDQAEFAGDASFDQAEFAGDASFDQAEFAGDASFDGAQFTGDPSFDRARFARGVPPQVAAFVRPVDDGADGTVEVSEFDQPGPG